MSVTVMTLTRTELSSQWRINHHQLLSLFHHPGFTVKKINVAKDSRAEAERVSSTIREYSEDNHCWGIASPSRRSRSRIGASQGSTLLKSSRKNAIDLATYSGVLERRKMIQVTMPVGVSKWVPWSLNATLKQFDFTCDSGVNRTPYSCSCDSSRRIRARLARRTQQFDFDSTISHVGRYDFDPKTKFRTNSSKILSWTQSTKKMINDELYGLSARRHNFYL